MRRAAGMQLALAEVEHGAKTYPSLPIAYGMTDDWQKNALMDSGKCPTDLSSWNTMRLPNGSGRCRNEVRERSAMDRRLYLIAATWLLKGRYE